MPLETVNARFTNPRDVLLAFQQQLTAALVDVIPDDGVIIADPDEWDDAPEPQLSGPFITLAYGDSQFPDDVQTGGGAATCEEIVPLVVTIFANERLDQTGHMPAAVFDDEHGLLELKRRVLRATVGTDPTGGDALPLLSQLVPIRNASKPRKNAQGVWFLSLTFGVSFFWDLT